MTNIEKAKEISGYDPTNEGWNYPEIDFKKTIYEACLKMAEWKDHLDKATPKNLNAKLKTSKEKR